MSTEIDEDLLFTFVPVDCEYENEDNKIFISKDSYFNIFHNKRKKWMSFRGDVLDRKETDNTTKSMLPQLCDMRREVDVFKANKADFEEIWETSFLLSSFPILIGLVEHLNPLKEKLNQDDMMRLRIFDESVEKANHSLFSLQQFIFNKLPSNIASGQEFSQISPFRQEMILDQHVLGMLCWLLKIGFPTNDELNLIDWGTINQDLGKNQKKEIITEHLQLKSQNNAKKLDKIRADHVLRKYQFCMNLYYLIQELCIQSSDNQEYVFKFIIFLVKHLGNGFFISRTINEVVKNNEKILYNLHKLDSIKGMVNLPIGQDKQHIDLFSEIISRFAEFTPYEKYEILDLLKCLCLNRSEAIYINQDKIFKLTYED